MITDLFETPQLCVQALFNGIYQGMILSLVLAAWLKWGRRFNASTRYAAAFVTLLMVALLPILHLVAEGMQAKGSTYPHVQDAKTQNSTPSRAIPDRLAQKTRPDAQATKPASSIVHTDNSLAPDAELLDPITRADKVTTGTSERMLRSQPLAPPVWKTEMTEWTLLSILWLCALFSLIGILRLGLQHARLLLLKKTSHHAEGPCALAFQEIKKEMGLRRSTVLRVSHDINSPIAAGFIRPAVLLPATLLGTGDGQQIQAILRHELAHIRRFDDWTNLIQQAVCALFPFHPAVCWISKRLNLEREIACDDHVLATTGKAREYALFLTEFAGRSRNQSWIAAPAAWNSQSQLKQRINMILDTHRNTSLRPARFSIGILTAGSLIIAIAALLTGPRLVIAEPFQSDTPPAPPMPPISKNIQVLEQDGEKDLEAKKDKVRTKDKESNLEARLVRLETMLHSLLEKNEQVAKEEKKVLVVRPDENRKEDEAIEFEWNSDKVLVPKIGKITVKPIPPSDTALDINIDEKEISNQIEKAMKAAQAQWKKAHEQMELANREIEETLKKESNPNYSKANETSKDLHKRELIEQRRALEAEIQKMHRKLADIDRQLQASKNEEGPSRDTLPEKTPTRP